MNNLLFTCLIIVLLYYFFYYLPQQKKLVSNPILTHAQSTQTNPILFENEPGSRHVQFPSAQKDLNEKVTNLKQQLKESKASAQQKQTQITNLQSEIRDLAKRPSKPTNSKSTQTDELTNTLNNLIKEVQDLNNQLD